MKNKKLLKAMLVVTAMVLVCVLSVLGTLAYLASTTDTVTNTFTVGKVTITLDEADVNEYGVAIENAERVIENEYKLINGHNYVKDPVIHVDSGSEQCYVFVKVVNGIEAIEAAGNTIESQMLAKGWLKLDGVENVWYKADAVDARNGAKDVPVFDSFTVDTGADISIYADAAITITAYAIQADGFTSATAAWAAAPSNFTK